MSDRKRICIACGGSAGHIFPGLSLAEELTRRYGDDVEILFLTSDNKLASSLFEKSGFNFYTLSLAGLKKRNFRDSFSFILNLFKGAFAAAKIIFSNRPDCFIGFGSYVSGPPFLIALLLGIPTLVHEQNAVMGKANRIMRHFASKVALSFPDQTKYKRRNVVFTGNPIRESAAKNLNKGEARDKLGMSRDKFTILIIGCSQVSHRINSIAAEMFANMEKELRDKIQVIHLSGESDYGRLKEAYQKIDILYRLYPFFEDMGTLYSAADISISRAGSSVIYELSAHGIPSILIPYPFAGAHQAENAEFLAARDAAIVIGEENLSSSYLLDEVKKLMNGQGLRDSIGKNMKTLTLSNAAEKLADEVGSLLWAQSVKSIL